LQERTLASYNKDVLGVLEAVTLRLSRVENSVDGLSGQVRALSETLQQVQQDTSSSAANTQHLRDKQQLIEEQQRLAETTLTEAKAEVAKLKDVANEAAKSAIRELQTHQQQQQQQADADDGAERNRAASPATAAPAIAAPAPVHPSVPQAPPGMASPYAPPPPAQFANMGMPPPNYPPPAPYPAEFHPPPPAMMMPPPPPPPMMDSPMYGYGGPPMGSGYAMPPTYSPPPPPAPPRGPPPPAPQLNTQAVSVDKVVNDVAAMGFSRNDVRDAIAALTSGGAGSVDLNRIIDYLMNGPGSAARQQSYYSSNR
jgi:hypothetical protein